MLPAPHTTTQSAREAETREARFPPCCWQGSSCFPRAVSSNRVVCEGEKAMCVDGKVNHHSEMSLIL
ncbi:hypothetical protein AMELA_G00070580 [Ameiurus melas]|uniref:Uncharacterized protein n=1 Tax=Ameiurus melas TaxID=219545 RepID=A0A7J6B433_AMEME|nr:hypothetical protein AMELA_G00070580 [Ameiurus melas]